MLRSWRVRRSITTHRSERALNAHRSRRVSGRRAHRQQRRAAAPRCGEAPRRIFVDASILAPSAVARLLLTRSAVLYALALTRTPCCSSRPEKSMAEMAASASSHSPASPRAVSSTVNVTDVGRGPALCSCTSATRTAGSELAARVPRSFHQASVPTSVTACNTLLVLQHDMRSVS